LKRVRRIFDLRPGRKVRSRQWIPRSIGRRPVQVKPSAAKTRASPLRAGAAAVPIPVDAPTGIPHAQNTVPARHFIHTLGVDLGGGKGEGRLRSPRCAPTPTAPRSSRFAPRTGAQPALRLDAHRDDPFLRRRHAPVRRRPVDLAAALPALRGPGLPGTGRLHRRRRRRDARHQREQASSAIRYRRGKPSITPLHAARDRGLPRAPPRHRAARGARAGDRPARGARGPPHARPRRSLQAQRQPPRGLSQGERWRRSASFAPTRSTSKSARRAPRFSRRCLPSCASDRASGESSASRATHLFDAG